MARLNAWETEICSLHDPNLSCRLAIHSNLLSRSPYPFMSLTFTSELQPVGDRPNTERKWNSRSCMMEYTCLEVSVLVKMCGFIVEVQISHKLISPRRRHRIDPAFICGSRERVIPTRQIVPKYLMTCTWQGDNRDMTVGKYLSPKLYPRKTTGNVPREVVPTFLQPSTPRSSSIQASRRKDRDSLLCRWLKWGREKTEN